MAASKYLQNVWKKGMKLNSPFHKISRLQSKSYYQAKNSTTYTFLGVFRKKYVLEFQEFQKNIFQFDIFSLML